MNELIFTFHSPEEVRQLSTQGHWVVGYIFLAIGIIALFQAFGVFASRKYLWPAAVVISGFTFLPYYFLHHGLENIGVMWQIVQADPQQRQHITIFVLIFIGGMVEFLLSIDKIRGKVLYFVWPGVLVISGLTLFFHPQHGTAEAIAFSVPYHRTLGTIVGLAGILKGAEVFVEKKRRWISFVWIIFLFVASILFITFNEPMGAYENMGRAL